MNKWIKGIATIFFGIVGGILFLILLKYINTFFALKPGTIIGILGILLPLYIASNAIAQLWKQKKYALLKRIALETPFATILFMALDTLENWYSGQPTMIIDMIRIGFLGASSWIVVRWAIDTIRESKRQQ